MSKKKLCVYLDKKVYDNFYKAFFQLKASQYDIFEGVSISSLVENILRDWTNNKNNNQVQKVPKKKVADHEPEQPKKIKVEPVPKPESRANTLLVIKDSISSDMVSPDTIINLDNVKKIDIHFYGFKIGTAKKGKNIYYNSSINLNKQSKVMLMRMKETTAKELKDDLKDRAIKYFTRQPNKKEIYLKKFSREAKELFE